MSKSKMYFRGKATKDWIQYFEITYKRKPTSEEGNAFGVGFNMGWDRRGKREKQKITGEEE